MPEPTPIDDRLLLSQFAREGSDDAFRSLRDRYWRLVYSTCLRETRDAALAEDAAQGVFLLLSKKASQLKRERSLAGWLFRASQLVSKNLMRSEQRRAARERQAFLDFESAQVTPEEAWRLIEPELNQALSKLSAADREAVLLRFVQDLSFAEVGAALGVAENSARMRVNRALERLRHQFQRAGIGISVTLLAIVLSQESAHAAPTPPTDLRPITPKANLQVVSRQLAAPKLAAVGALGLGKAVFTLAIGSRLFGTTSGTPLTSPQRQALFSSLAGTWTGNLEYADDRTRQHFTYPTTVTGKSEDDRSFVLESRYVGAANVDQTRVELDIPSGKYRISSGGPNSSHTLDGLYEARHQPDGSDVFTGDSQTLKAIVHLRFKRTGSGLTIEETYRRPGDKEDQFRNRYTLTRL